MVSKTPENSNVAGWQEHGRLTSSRGDLLSASAWVEGSVEEQYLNTKNAYQLIGTFRKMVGLSQPQMGEMFGCDASRISRFEAGAALPSKETLEKLENNASKPSTRDPSWERFVERLVPAVITSRLSIIHDLNTRQPSKSQISKYLYQLAELPAIYWQTGLQQINAPESSLASPKTSDWAAFIKPINSKMEYLRAVRYALMLTDAQINQATGLTDNQIKGIEYGDIALDGKAAKDLIDYYTKKSTELSEAADAPPCFDAAAYAGLDDGQKLFKPRESPRHRTSGRVVT